MKLELMSKGTDSVVFAETGRLIPRLYKISRKKWNAKGSPEVVYI